MEEAEEGRRDGGGGPARAKEKDRGAVGMAVAVWEAEDEAPGLVPVKEGQVVACASRTAQRRRRSADEKEGGKEGEGEGLWPLWTGSVARV